MYRFKISSAFSAEERKGQVTHKGCCIIVYIPVLMKDLIYLCLSGSSMESNKSGSVDDTLQPNKFF